MLIHTFHGRSAAEALARARRELGPEACVLETRRTGRGVEVLAVAERPAPARPEPPRSDEPVRVLYEELHERLVADGFARPLAARIAAAAAARASEAGDDAARALRVALALWLRVDGDEPRSGQSLAIVGPPGVGKTTTIAKIAAREAARRDGPVVLASMDDQRLGGLEQLEATARAMGLPFRALRDEDEVIRARRAAGRHGLLLVDTPGVSRGDADVVRRIRTLTGRLDHCEIELLLAADADRRAVTDTVHRFSRLEPTCVGVTKLDEAARAGGLISVLVRTGLPVRHVTTGPVIPDDLARATVRGLAAWAIPAVDSRSQIPATTRSGATAARAATMKETR